MILSDTIVQSFFLGTKIFVNLSQHISPDLILTIVTPGVCFHNLLSAIVH